MRIAQIAPLIESVPPKLYGGTRRQRYGQCNHLWQCGIVGHVTLPRRAVHTEANPWRSHYSGWLRPAPLIDICTPCSPT
jgi:hypothetical protein